MTQPESQPLPQQGQERRFAAPYRFAFTDRIVSRLIELGVTHPAFGNSLQGFLEKIASSTADIEGVALFYKAPFDEEPPWIEVYTLWSTRVSLSNRLFTFLEREVTLDALWVQPEAEDHLGYGVDQIAVDYSTFQAMDFLEKDLRLQEHDEDGQFLGSIGIDDLKAEKARLGTLTSIGSQPNRAESRVDEPWLLRDQLLAAIPRLIAKKKESLEKDYGDASDYGIRGIVLVGSVAAGTERPESDIDLYVISFSGYEFVGDFAETLAGITKQTVRVLGVMEVPEEAQGFTDDDWKRESAESGFPQDCPFSIILA